jgi:hypothetical protein
VPNLAGKKKKGSEREVEIDRGVYVVKSAALKAGTHLTRDRLNGNFRSPNRRGMWPTTFSRRPTAGAAR